MSAEQRETILVVEDEGVVARQLQLSLSDLGYRVPCTASCAAEALQAAERDRFSLVLMDVHLAEGDDGIELATTLRARYDVPVLYLTAYADPATLARAKVTEPYAYLVKPVDADRLRTAVEVALHKHEMDRRLRISEAKFSGIVSISADAIVAIDEEQRIRLFNAAAEAMFGHSEAEAIGAPLETLIPERLRSAHGAHVDRFAGGVPGGRRVGACTDVVGRRKSGEEFPAEASIARLDVAGLRLLTVALRDMSERQRAMNEQRLLIELGSVLSATLEYERTVANLAALMVREGVADRCVVDVVDEAGNVRRVGAAADDPSEVRARALDCAEASARRGDLRELVDARTRLLEGRDVALERVLATATDLRSAIVAPLAVRGRVFGAMVLATARRYDAEDVRLAGEIAARAALAIENAALYESARRAIEARDHVLSVVAHDLRNPLNSILLGSRLMREEAPEGGGSRESLDAMERAARRMDRLIQDLLDVARAESRSLTLDPRRVPAGELVFESVRSHRALASSRTLSVDVPRDPGDVWADRDRVLQVLGNLIGNALKFTRPDGRVTVGAERRSGVVVFWVSDDGDGISPDDVPHVFDRFWRGPRRGRDGVGLGLAIVKWIVDAHGGRAWVESAMGRGSTFFFELPSAEAAPTDVVRDQAA